MVSRQQPHISAKNNITPEKNSPEYAPYFYNLYFTNILSPSQQKGIRIKIFICSLRKNFSQYLKDILRVILESQYALCDRCEKLKKI